MLVHGCIYLHKPDFVLGQQLRMTCYTHWTASHVGGRNVIPTGFWIGSFQADSMVRCATFHFEVRRTVEAQWVVKIHVFMARFEVLHSLLDHGNNMRTLTWINGSIRSGYAKFKTIVIAHYNQVCVSIDLKVHLVSVSTLVWVNNPGRKLG